MCIKSLYNDCLELVNNISKKEKKINTTSKHFKVQYFSNLSFIDKLKKLSMSYVGLSNIYCKIQFVLNKFIFVISCVLIQIYYFHSASKFQYLKIMMKNCGGN